jgi:hypothetical protein
MSSPDEFNLHFTSAAAGSGSDEVFDRDEVFDGFAFSWRLVEKAGEVWIFGRSSA